MHPTVLLDRQRILDAVYRAIDAVNELRPANERLPKAPDLVLLGAQSSLDSLALTTLVLAVERNVEDLTGTTVELLASSDGPAGLKTVDSTVDTILRQLEA